MNLKHNIIFIAFLSILLLNSACKKQMAKDDTNQDLVQSLVPDTIIVEDEVWLVDEDKMNDIPLSSESPKVENKTVVTNKNGTQQSPDQKKSSGEKTTTVKKSEIDSMLTHKQYISTDTIQEELMVIPLEETQTIVSYNKKGVEKESFQVISTADGEVEQIVFTDKKHVDIYDVRTGMTGKEVKTIRKELKHMIKHGKVFLYDDQSNIMYLMDSRNNAGEEITESDIEPMEVQAIIWKDKKHHKKD